MGEGYGWTVEDSDFQAVGDTEAPGFETVVESVADAEVAVLSSAGAAVVNVTGAYLVGRSRRWTIGLVIMLARMMLCTIQMLPWLIVWR